MWACGRLPASVAIMIGRSLLSYSRDSSTTRVRVASSSSPMIVVLEIWACFFVNFPSVAACLGGRRPVLFSGIVISTELVINEEIMSPQ